LYLGIDQHRKQLTVSIRNEAGDVVLRRQVSTEWGHARAFFDELRRLAEPEGGFAAIARFPRPASLANYWGLTPGCRNWSNVVTSRAVLRRSPNSAVPNIAAPAASRVIKVLGDGEGIRRSCPAPKGLKPPVTVAFIAHRDSNR
jgi:hypothetical protein